ncbi:hypothetical protein J1N35_019572 [Gossypium stocksii]|uniref:RNase H type-1 domain-containing protein n=1 Tax=Gossypium stocksii TaxID=47602 RepID=A0A9D3VT58_9ROSI|nr:hypothetical protein J1N35_019572 [Gossypium stocksii]
MVDASVAEGQACEQAVLLVADLSFRHVVIEGDSLTVIKKLVSVSMDRSTLGQIIIAHAFAWEGRLLAEPHYRIEEAPDVV